MLNKSEILKFYKLSCDNYKDDIGILEDSDLLFNCYEFEENCTIIYDYVDGYFGQLNINRFEDKMLLCFLRLGQDTDSYKEWSFKKFMSALSETCINIDKVHFEYDLCEENELDRGCFIYMLVDISGCKIFNDVYLECLELSKKIVEITIEKLNNIWWNKEYEKNEKLFCLLYLNAYFNNLGFDVTYTHGVSEYGRDFVLKTINNFGKEEYYGVQAKAGNVSGSATGDILELINQMKFGFTVPYTLVDGTKVYMSKMIIAISGNYTENAKQIIQSQIKERPQLTNLIFKEKKDFITTPI